MPSISLSNRGDGLQLKNQLCDMVRVPQEHVGQCGLRRHHHPVGCLYGSEVQSFRSMRSDVGVSTSTGWIPNRSHRGLMMPKVDPRGGRAVAGAGGNAEGRLLEGEDYRGPGTANTLTRHRKRKTRNGPQIAEGAL